MREICRLETLCGCSRYADLPMDAGHPLRRVRLPLQRVIRAEDIIAEAGTPAAVRPRWREFEWNRTVEIESPFGNRVVHEYLEVEP